MGPLAHFMRPMWPELPGPGREFSQLVVTGVERLPEILGRQLKAPSSTPSLDRLL